MSKRRSIHVPGLAHKAPIPNAAVVDNVLMSGGIGGQDPETGNVPDSLDEQAALVFANARRIVEAAGGSLDDIVKFTFFMRDRRQKDAIDRIWLELFPDPDTRPARHTFTSELAEPLLVQCDIVAVL